MIKFDVLKAIAILVLVLMLGAGILILINCHYGFLDGNHKGIAFGLLIFAGIGFLEFYLDYRKKRQKRRR